MRVLGIGTRVVYEAWSLPAATLHSHTSSPQTRCKNGRSRNPSWILMPNWKEGGTEGGNLMLTTLRPNAQGSQHLILGTNCGNKHENIRMHIAYLSSLELFALRLKPSWNIVSSYSSLIDLQIQIHNPTHCRMSYRFLDPLSTPKLPNLSIYRGLQS